MSDSRKPGNPDPVAAALARYPMPGRPRVTPITRGLIHQTWRVEDGDARYVLQRLNPLFSLDVHQNIEAVTSRLAERGLETPRLCRTRTNALFADLGSDVGRFRLMTLVEGASYDTCGSPARAASAGRLVARFHSALDDLEHDFAPLGFPFHDAALHLAELARALEEHRDHRLWAEVQPIALQIREVVEQWQSLGDVPDRVVHLDLKFNNILFRPAAPGDAPEARCLIDLDTLSRMPLWVDLGDAWRSWCNRHREHEPEALLDPSIFEASAAAWLDAVTLDLGRAELESLAHAIERLSIELCARFAADALRESYFGWNPELFASAGEHNLSRARGQLSLHAQARETRADRLRFLLG